MSNDARPDILIVDDDGSMAAVIQLMLDRAGYHARVARSGQSALELARHRPPDAVILDLMLPDRDTPGLLRRLRRQRQRDVPVIVVTGSTDERRWRESEAAGASAILTKPVNRAELVEQLALALGRVPATAAARGPA